jgi:hypothetical protein
MEKYIITKIGAFLGLVVAGMSYAQVPTTNENRQQ